MSRTSPRPTSVVEIDAQRFDLVVFDLDGVLTDTATLHADAWKRVFDAYLRQHAGPGFRPFDADNDYRAHVDGRPRLEGVRDFLASRCITLPEGVPDDPPGSETLWGLGNRKNGLYRELLATRGVRTADSTRALLEQLEQSGLLIGVVSASRNTRAVLDGSDLDVEFDVVIDGLEASRLGLRGKPHPDTFLEAARRLEVDPRRAVVFEDAAVGVEAARAGGFGLVVGVDAGEGSAELRARGADEVVRDLSEVTVAALPCGSDALAALVNRIDPRRIAVFLDYDGTLCPIAPRPADAVLDDEMRRTLRRLAERCTVAVVTGRDLDDIRGLVQFDGVIYYAANHGFQIEAPGRESVHHEKAASFVPLIEQTGHELREQLDGIAGALVESKRQSVAVHYRLVSDADVARVRGAVDTMLARHPDLRCLHGKKVYELLPRIDWDKGHAVLWLAEVVGIEPEDMIYVGDDVTDEDVFRAIRGRGAGIVVWERPRPTAAAYWLPDSKAVGRLLRAVCDWLEDEDARA